MNPPSEDIKDILEGETGLALTFATDLFIGQMPETPDACVCVYDSGGYPGEENYLYERPTVQVKVRGGRGGYKIAHELCQNIRDVLHGLHNVTVNSARYVGIWVETDVMSIGPDELHRPHFTVNFRIHRTDTA
jgi:hypothetical protein